MAQKDIMLDNIKKTLEMMYESEEQKGLSREELNQNRDLYQKMKENLKEIIEFKTNNLAKLEDIQYLLKDNISKYKQEIFNIAQQMYYNMQELYSDLNLRHSGLDENEGLIQKSDEKLKKKVDEFKIIEATSMKRLESLEKEEAEVNRKKETEANIISAENEEIKAEIKMLDQQIQYYEDNFTGNLVIPDEEENYATVIENLQECVKSTENETEELLALLEEEKRFRKTSEIEEDNKILELDNQIRTAETEINTKKLLINDNQLKIDDSARKIETIKNSNKSKEDECNNIKNEIDNTKMYLTDAEVCSKIIKCIEQSVIENEEKFKQQENIREQIKLDTCVLENKIKSQEEQMAKILQFLAEHEKIDANLNTELEEKEERRRDLKNTVRQSVECYNKQLLEIENEVKRSQEEIDAREQVNKKLQEDTDALVLEVIVLKTDVEREKGEPSREMEELDSEIETLKIKLAQAKASKLKNKRKSADTSKPTSQASGAFKEKKLCVRHWDSDSSAEGEDRRFLDMIKHKMRIRKIGKNNPK